MNIYLYGSQDFKKEIYKIFETSQIKKLYSGVIIKEINNLKNLEDAIKAQPEDIYLIDDEKIAKKNSLKPKIFISKDAIAEQFLIDNGIADLTIDSLDELPEYVVRKYELEKNLNDTKIGNNQEEQVEFDSELSKISIKDDEKKEEEKLKNISNKEENNISGLNLNELENLIETPVEEKKEANLNNSDKNISELEDFNNDFGLNNISFDYDDNNILNDASSSNDDVLGQIFNASSLDNYEFLGETFENENFLDDDFHEKIKTVDTLEDMKPKVETADEIENTFKEFDNFNDLNEVFENKEEIQEQDLVEENIDLINNKKEVVIEPEEDKLDEQMFEDEKIEESVLENSYKEENISLKDDKKEIIIEPIENKKIYEVPKEFKGEDMSENEFSELDSLNEKDLVEALNYSVDNVENATKTEVPQVVSSTKNEESIVLNSSNVDELSHLISKLLSNKTLEITIKLKD